MDGLSLSPILALALPQNQLEASPAGIKILITLGIYAEGGEFLSGHLRSQSPLLAISKPRRISDSSFPSSFSSSLLQVSRSPVQNWDLLLLSSSYRKERKWKKEKLTVSSPPSLFRSLCSTRTHTHKMCVFLPALVWQLCEVGFADHNSRRCMYSYGERNIL